MKELKQCLVLVGSGYVASMESWKICVYIYISKTVSTKSRIFFRPQLEWILVTLAMSIKAHRKEAKLKTNRNLLCFLATFASNNTFIASNQARHQRGEKTLDIIRI